MTTALIGELTDKTTTGAGIVEAIALGETVGLAVVAPDGCFRHAVKGSDSVGGLSIGEIARELGCAAGEITIRPVDASDAQWLHELLTKDDVS